MKINFKRGDTFALQNGILEDGVAKDATGWSVRSQIRSVVNSFVVDLDFAWVNQTGGTYQLRCDDTTGWPTGNCPMDIEYTTDTGQILSTETFIIAVQVDITHDD